MNPQTVNNYLNNGLKFAQNFVQGVAKRAEANVWEGNYGYGSTFKHIGKYAQYAANQAGKVKKATAAAAGTINDLLTDQTRREWWHYTNVPRMAGDIGRAMGRDLGMSGTLAGALVGIGVPLVNQTVSGGGFGYVKEGFRPKGYKSLAPASLEEDPTGRTPISAPVDATLRFLTGRPGDVLPYHLYKEERPDILPSQYQRYRSYLQKKNKPGKYVTIDPETGTFVTAQGIVRGSVEGLAGDPEIRLMGRPVTASAVAGIGAGYAAMKGLQAATEVPFSRKVKLNSMVTKLENELGKTVKTLGTAAKTASYPMPSQVATAGGKVSTNPEYFNQLKELSKNLTGAETYGKKIEHLHKRIEEVGERAANAPGPDLNLIQQAGQALGPYKNLAVAGAGIATALGVGYATKKALQKASEQRIKKSNPVEYLKHKHGSLEAAGAALGQPNARSWQELASYV
jgi:hypothetical protein